MEIQFAMRPGVYYREHLDQLCDSLPIRHRETLVVVRAAPELPDRRLEINSRPRRIRCRAHANSLAKTTSPAGITSKAGPGRTIITRPMTRRVPPITPTISLRAPAGRLSNPILALSRASHCIRLRQRSLLRGQRFVAGAVLYFTRVIPRILTTRAWLLV